MAAIVVWRIDDDRVASALHEAGTKLDSVEGELVLDFSAVHRLDANALYALQELAGAVERKAVSMRLRGVNVEIYKVLKLAGLTTQFSFVN